jgi:uncharacterized repeat protein (TIGR03847 family)
VTFFAEFDDVDEFTARVVGQPGSRVFYLTARAAGQRVTVRCEKQQVKAIATYLRHVLSDLPPPDDRPLLPPGDGTTAPSEPVFVLGPIGLGYDRRNDRLLVQLEEMVAAATSGDDDDEAGGSDAEADEPDRGHVRFYVTRSQADAFCDHAEQIVAAGRPQCRWCGNPIDPDGHSCPRMN